MFELVLNGLNWFKPVAHGYNRFLQCLNWFEQVVATGYNRLLQCLNWFEQVYIGLNWLQRVTIGCCNV